MSAMPSCAGTGWPRNEAAALDVAREHSATGEEV